MYRTPCFENGLWCANLLSGLRADREFRSTESARFRLVIHRKPRRRSAAPRGLARTEGAPARRPASADFRVGVPTGEEILDPIQPAQCALAVALGVAAADFLELLQKLAGKGEVANGGFGASQFVDSGFG